MHCSRRRLIRRGLEFHVCTLNKSAHTKKVWKLILVYIIQNGFWMLFIIFPCWSCLFQLDKILQFIIEIIDIKIVCSPRVISNKLCQSVISLHLTLIIKLIQPQQQWPLRRHRQFNWANITHWNQSKEFSGNIHKWFGTKWVNSMLIKLFAKLMTKILASHRYSMTSFDFQVIKKSCQSFIHVNTYVREVAEKISANKEAKNRLILFIYWLVGWLVVFYGIWTFEGYLTPNPF